MHHNAAINASATLVFGLAGLVAIVVWYAKVGDASLGAVLVPAAVAGSFVVQAGKEFAQAASHEAPPIRWARVVALYGVSMAVLTWVFLA